MGSRFVEGLSIADVVTLMNGVIGFLAIIVAPDNPELAARLILLAAVADGVDGVVARYFGGSEIGPYLDSLADVSSFALAPAVLIYIYIAEMSVDGLPTTAESGFLIGIPALFVTLAVLRLGVYSAHDTASTATIGATSTLAATILAASLLTVHATDIVVAVGCLVLAFWMIAPIEYPDLLARDALIMGVIHVLAILFPAFYGRVFPYALLTLAIAYLLLAPRWYWGETERELRGPTSPKGKRS